MSNKLLSPNHGRVLKRLAKAINELEGDCYWDNSHLEYSPRVRSAKYLPTTEQMQLTLTDGRIILTHEMAGGSSFETNEDIKGETKRITEDMSVKIVFFNCALCDFEPEALSILGEETDKFGKYEGRLSSKEHPILVLRPAEKLIKLIRATRKDIFLIGFKATCGDTKQEMYLKGLNLCKTSSCNLVLVNDTKTRQNFILTPEEAAYHETQDRDEVLRNLIDMTFYRSHLTFTQSKVIDGKPIPWDDSRIPLNLRTVVYYCIEKGAYQVFNGSSVGHFAVRLSETEFLTSIRRTNFNKINQNGMVYVKTDGPDTVLAYGAKPSVGGQSQRIVFKDHPGFDCILHFHCEMKKDAIDLIPVTSQRNFECGSHECGENTSHNLKQFGNLKAVFLENHGPNIIFGKDCEADEIMSFIERNFDLTTKTGGYQLQ